VGPSAVRVQYRFLVGPIGSGDASGERVIRHAVRFERRARTCTFALKKEEGGGGAEQTE
jgi:hypothetical protein